MRTVTSLMKTEHLELVYFTYFHLIMSSGIVFVGNSTDSIKAFYNQKRIIKIIAGTKRKASCQEFKNFNILPLASVFLLIIIIHSGQHGKLSN
jgi:hypothetical protein